MAAVPIITGVIGAVGTISSIQASQQQAAAQRSALAAQQRATEANAQLRLIELQRQEEYQKNLQMIDALRRNQEAATDSYILGYEKLQAQAAQQEAAFNIRAQQINTLNQTAQAKQQAAQAEYQGKLENIDQQKQAISARSAGMDVQAQARGQAKQNFQNAQATQTQAEQAFNKSDQQRAAVMAQLGALGVDPRTMSTTQVLGAVGGLDLNAELLRLQQAARLSDEDMQNILASDELAGSYDRLASTMTELGTLKEQLALSQANLGVSTADSAERYANLLAEAQSTDLGYGKQQTELAAKIAASTREQQYLSDAAQSALNASYASSANRTQQVGVSAAAQAQSASLNAQIKGVTSPSMGLGLAQAATQVYGGILQSQRGNGFISG